MATTGAENAARRHSWVRICNVASGSSYFWDQESGETSWSAPPTLGDAELDEIEKISVGHAGSSNPGSGGGGGGERDSAASASLATDPTADAVAPHLAWERVSVGLDKEYWWNPRSDETRWSLPDPVVRDSADEAKSSSLNGRALAIGGAENNAPANTASPLSASAQQRGQRSPGSSSGGKGRRKFFHHGSHGNHGNGGAATSAPASAAASASAPGSGANQGEASGPGLEPSPNLDEKSSRKHRKSKSKGSDGARELQIGGPTDVQHHVHVRFDAKTARYSGLPKEWDLSSQALFGIELSQGPRVEVDGYEARIPVVLTLLKDAFERLGGPTAEGIFRIAPDGSECKHVKDQLNQGKGADALLACTDPHVPANLIKQFFRELRPNILSRLSRDAIVAIADNPSDQELMASSVDGLQEPAKSVLLWLLDLLCAVSANKDVNKMTLKNIAIVMNPNLYDVADMPPMEALVISQKLAVALENILAWRRDNLNVAPPSEAHAQTVASTTGDAQEGASEAEATPNAPDNDPKDGAAGCEKEIDNRHDTSDNWGAAKMDNNNILFSLGMSVPPVSTASNDSAKLAHEASAEAEQEDTSPPAPL